MNKRFPKNHKKLLYILQDKNVLKIIFKNRFCGEKRKNPQVFMIDNYSRGYKQDCLKKSKKVIV